MKAVRLVAPGQPLEMQEIDPVLTYKQNNIHRYVTERQAAG